MNAIIALLLAAAAPTQVQHVYIDAVVETDAGTVAVDRCLARGHIQYTSDELSRLVLSIPLIECRDLIFSDGFEPPALRSRAAHPPARASPAAAPRAARAAGVWTRYRHGTHETNPPAGPASAGSQ